MKVLLLQSVASPWYLWYLARFTGLWNVLACRTILQNAHTTYLLVKTEHQDTHSGSSSGYVSLAPEFRLKSLPSVSARPFLSYRGGIFQLTSPDES
jgi:hypothetical protein